MKTRCAATLALLVGAPFTVASACALPSFERIPKHEDDVTGGKGNVSGAGGMATGGMAPGGQGTGGGDGGAPGGEGGVGGTPGTIHVFKTYEVEQGTSLGISKSEGLFVYSGSDDRDWTSVARSSTDPRANIATLSITRGDGSFTFDPAPELFGVYHATYELRNAADDVALGDLYITVQPRTVDLGAVVSDIGGFALTGPMGEGVGRAVSSAGNVDNDDYDDFLVGAPAAAGGDGRVYVVFGGPENESFDLEPSPGSGARFAVLDGATLDGLGTSVSAAGDLDGDGFDDFVLGAPGELGAANGRAYVIRGRPRSELSGAVRDVVSAGGFTVTRGGGENVGTLVAGGGDLTGDATPDLVVFAGLSRTFYVVDGTASGDVDVATGSAKVFRGNTAGDAATWRALALLGDVDTDGAGELLVGTGLVAALLKGPASTYPPTLARTDFASANGVLVENPAPLGLVSASAAADFDGDGAGDSAFCHKSSPASERCRVFLGMPASENDGVVVTGFGGGEVRVAGGGETSGDGFADLLLSETGTGGTSQAWVVYGRSQPASSLNVGSLGLRGFAIDGGVDIQSVALAGDIDGTVADLPSTADWLVGDVGAANGDGRVYVIFGGRFSR